MILRRIDQALTELAYRSQHLSFLINATVMQEGARIVTRTPRKTLEPAELAVLNQRRKALHDRDLANVRDGMYPRELLFDFPIRQYLRSFPRLIRDSPNVIRRMRRGDYKDIPRVDKERYPAYYRRTFHWQTDGYFSDYSAEVYELGVELLFRGTANVMRRQIIPPVTRHVQALGVPAEQIRLLDVACGTGRTLHQLARAHPKLRYYGIDLSPPYIRTARKRLADVGELALAVENGEEMPFADATFDVVTSVYLFHELPRNARRNVAREMFRVVKPGGLVVIEDSAQPSESAALERVLRDFPREFHEPFYDDYLRDDLASLFAEVGFVVERTEPHLVAKVVIAHRP